MDPAALLGLVWTLLLVAAPPVARLACRAFGLFRPNFRGDQVPSSGGIMFLIVAAGTYAALTLSGIPLAHTAPIFLLVAIGFGLLGLLDDLWGTRAVRGFRGHLGALLQGRPTTGGIKLAGGGALALVTAWLLRGAWPPALLDALVIALAANTLNLLDTRPGRALLGFALLSLPSLTVAAFTGSRAGGVLLAPVGAAAALAWLPDARGRVMMGDTGSNLLGGVAGLAAAIELPVPGKAVLLFLLFLLNLAAERVSFSRVIEQTPWLAAIDRRLGVR